MLRSERGEPQLLSCGNRDRRAGHLGEDEHIE